MTSSDEWGKGLVYKPTGFATNSPRIAEMLNKRCTNHDSKAKHRHVILLSGRAKAAQVYPPALCRAICQGLLKQKEDDQRRRYVIGSLEAPQNKDEVKRRHEEARASARKAHIEEEEEAQYAIDDVSGRPLD
eukprot:6486121-Karenia_brevis.AAC.1